MKTKTRKKASWLSRLGWLILIWTSSILILAVLAFGFRLLMNAAGLSSTSQIKLLDNQKHTN